MKPPSDPNARFLDMAVALDALTPEERERVLDVLSMQPDGEAAAMAEKLGFLTKADRERIEAQVSGSSSATTASSTASSAAPASTSSSTTASSNPAPTPAPTRAPSTPRQATAPARKAPPKRGTGRTPRKPATKRPDPAAVLPMFAGAVALGVVAGLLTLFAIGSGEATAQPADPEATASPSPGGERAGLPARPAPDRELAQAARRAVRIAEGLQRDSKEVEALAILDGFQAEHPRVLLVAEARRALAVHCKKLVEGEVRRAQALTRKGSRRAGIKLLARLLARVPRSLHGPINDQVARMERRPQPEPAGDDDDDSDPKLPDPEQGPDWAKQDPKPTATPTAGPTPEPKPAGDDDDDDTMPKPTATPKADPQLAAKVAKRVTVQHRFDPNTRWLDVTYPLRRQGDVIDFRHRGFDKFDVGVRDLVRYANGRLGLEIGASSQRLGRMIHGIQFDGDFEIDLRVWCSAASGRTVMIFLLGRSHGVQMGQQLVRVARSGRFKPLTRVVDPTVFRQERVVEVKMVFKSNKLSVRCNGRETARGTFTKGELKGPFGLLARDVNMQITYLRIRAVVDPAKL